MIECQRFPEAFQGDLSPGDPAPIRMYHSWKQELNHKIWSEIEWVMSKGGQIIYMVFSDDIGSRKDWSLKPGDRFWLSLSYPASPARPVWVSARRYGERGSVGALRKNGKGRGRISVFSAEEYAARQKLTQGWRGFVLNSESSEAKAEQGVLLDVGPAPVPPGRVFTDLDHILMGLE